MSAINIPESPTPATPAANRRKLYPKSDGWYQLDDLGVESSIANGVTSVAGESGVVTSAELVAAIQTDLDAIFATDASVTTVQSNLNAHIADATDAHAASAITNTPAGTISAVTVQAAINELDTEKATTGSVSTVASDLAAHIADTTAAHAASSIGFTPAAGIAATDVQAAIVEDAGDLAAHIASATAHNGSNLVFTPQSGIAATNVSAAIVEAKTDSAISASTPDATGNANALVLTGQQIQQGMATLSFPGIISAENYRKLTNSSVIDMQRDFDSYYCNDNYLGGGNDDTTPLQTAITQAQTAKGKIILLGSTRAGSLNRSRVTSTLQITQNGVTLMGPGRAYTTDVGTYYESGGYWFVWRGTAGQTVLNCVPSNTGALAIPLLGLRLSGFNIDCRDFENGTDAGAAQGGKGIYMAGVCGARVDDVFIMSASVAALDLEALADGTFTGSGVAGSQGVLRSHFTNICIRQLDGATRGPGLRLRGNAAVTANPNFNQFHTMQIMYDGANTGNPAMDIGDSDSNTFQMIACNRSGSTQNNWGIVIRGSNTSASAVARANIFYHVSPGANGAIKCGTANGRRPDGTVDASFNYSNPATDNVFCPQSTENGEPVVYCGATATGIDGYTGGSTVVGHLVRPAVLQTQITSTTATTVEVSLIPVTTVPANFIRDKTVFRWTVTGVLSNTVTASTFTIRAKVSGVNVGVLTFSSGAIARTNCAFTLTILLTARTSGTACPTIANGHLATQWGTQATPLVGTGTTATTNINTTVSNSLDLTCIGATGTPSLTATCAILEVVC